MAISMFKNRMTEVMAKNIYKMIAMVGWMGSITAKSKSPRDPRNILNTATPKFLPHVSPFLLYTNTGSHPFVLEILL
jgi:hypothetical protein